MSAEIYHYRDHQKAVDRWSNMERLHLMRAQGLIPILGGEEGVMAFTGSPSLELDGVIDTAPCEWVVPEQDPA